MCVFVCVPVFRCVSVCVRVHVWSRCPKASWPPHVAPPSASAQTRKPAVAAVAAPAAVACSAEPPKKVPRKNTYVAPICAARSTRTIKEWSSDQLCYFLDRLIEGPKLKREIMVRLQVSCGVPWPLFSRCPPSVRPRPPPFEAPPLARAHSSLCRVSWREGVGARRCARHPPTP